MFLYPWNVVWFALGMALLSLVLPLLAVLLADRRHTAALFRDEDFEL